MSWPWSELGLPGPADLRSIRSAYAQRLKTTHPEEDPEGFQRLHAAYQEASRYARRAARRTDGASLADAARDAPQAAEPEAPSPKPAVSPEPPPEGTETPDWNYDALLETKEPPEAEPRAADWDYERLFAEGEAEAQEALRRKLEDLRRKNRARLSAQERAQRKRAEDEEESWAAVMAAVHALELLYTREAPLSQWQRFLHDPVFLNVRANLDFVFALEDFLEQHPELSSKIRRAFFNAYESQNASKYPAYRRLYRLLGVSRKDVQRTRSVKSPWRSAWRSYPPWRKAVIAVCFSILAVFFVVGCAVNIRTSYQTHLEKKDREQWEANILDWLEEDYGEPFDLAVRPRIYAPLSDPALYFWVLRDGERGEGSPGYRTDYAHVRIMRAMEDFADERSLELKLDSAGGFSGDIGDAPGAYLFSLPLRGAEEDITALGALVEELKGQDWYQAAQTRYGGDPLEYQIFLCHKGLSFYDAISTKSPFDTEEALSRYDSAGPAFCRYILETSGLPARHMGEGAYFLADQGEVEIDGAAFFQVAGFDKETREPKVEYLLSGGTLFCLPEGTEVFRITDLYRGAVSHLQLDSVGLVIVLDQTETG